MYIIRYIPYRNIHRPVTGHNYEYINMLDYCGMALSGEPKTCGQWRVESGEWRGMGLSSPEQAHSILKHRYTKTTGIAAVRAIARMRFRVWGRVFGNGRAARCLATAENDRIHLRALEACWHIWDAGMLGLLESILLSIYPLFCRRKYYTSYSLSYYSTGNYVSKTTQVSFNVPLDPWS